MIDFLAANWVWIALVLAFLAMQRGGGCGSHGNHVHGRRDQMSGASEHAGHR